jgi:HEAT repeat protein
MLWWTLQKLKSSDWETRAGAARALADARESKAVPGLIKALEDAIGGERQAVTEALGTIGHPAAVDALISALKGRQQQPKIRRQDSAAGTETAEYKAAAEALASIGPPSLNPLIGLLNSDDKNHRRWAAYALGRIKDAKALDPLIERLQDPRSEVRQAAARALGDLGEPRAAQALVKIVAGRDLETRRAAADALGMLGVVEAVDVLGTAAHDPNEPLQLAAIEALRRIGGLKAGSKVRSALEAGKKAVRESAIAALASMRFESASPEDRAAGAVLRGEFETALGEGPAAAGALVSALSSRDPGHRLRAVRALGTLRSERTIQPLLSALDDHDRAVQEAAAAALVSIGIPAVSGLVEMLTSERSSLRRFAALALGGICDPGTAGALVDAITASQRASGDDSDSCVAAEAAVKALSGMLTKSAASIPPNVLQRIVAMSGSLQAGFVTGTGAADSLQQPMNWNVVQDLARQELHRRGISEERP